MKIIHRVFFINQKAVEKGSCDIISPKVVYVDFSLIILEDFLSDYSETF